MKKLFFAALILCATTAVNAQDDTKKAPAANPNAPDISFESETHDFGTIPYSGNGTYEFKFTNTGKEPLVISNAKGSCGCTVPSWPKEPILKGHSGVISVHYDTKRPGPFTKTVTVSSNGKTAEKVLTIKGNVETKEQTESGTPVKKDNTMTPKETTTSPFGN
ncbi:MAG TPA: DUF1573 domain-containing protein [Bacteroidia bacterium]|nr:DUF1573 domain-containing protein [Bacteroidia bacterium]MBP7714099.1 DUF1573 domain-containing protein [Bacteroidia bacterium]MBP8668726.1 DUF1573 domain-containing protein [Bacteroidia bacterium]HOZ81752.1 DUF1573 domain-containing protein [Bacteroidia bacterium]HQW17151.1 DUF1573 domain-containing protein [Bacteroidia bacterium]